MAEDLRWCGWFELFPFSQIHPKSKDVVGCHRCVLLFQLPKDSLTSASDSSLQRNLSRVNYHDNSVAMLYQFDHVRYVKLCAMWSYVKLCEAMWSYVKLCEAMWSYVKLMFDDLCEFLNMRQRQFIVHLYELLSCHRRSLQHGREILHDFATPWHTVFWQFQTSFAIFVQQVLALQHSVAWSTRIPLPWCPDAQTDFLPTVHMALRLTHAVQTALVASSHVLWTPQWIRNQKWSESCSCLLQKLGCDKNRVLSVTWLTHYQQAMADSAMSCIKHNAYRLKHPEMIETSLLFETC